MPEIYLDHSATTPVLPEIARAVQHCLLEAYGNPSSLHPKGVEAERLVRTARQQVAAALGVEPEEVIFTSGGTEANNLAIQGVARARARQGRHLVTTRIEHPSVLAACRALEEEGYTVTYVPVDSQGLVDPEAVAAAIRPDTVLVSIMYVNNEVGSTLPVASIAAAVRARNPHVLLHVDAVQAFGLLPVLPRRLGVDLLSVSGHKIHAPKGIGALYVRHGVRLAPLFGGGEQERGLRSGTENVPGIVGLGMAAEISQRQREEAAAQVRRLRDQLVRGLLAAVPGSALNGPPLEGPPELSAPHIANLSFPGVRGEVLVRALGARGLYVSTGAACSSRKGPSHVLQAMGLSPERVEGCLRFSLARHTTAQEIEAAIGLVRETVEQLAAFANRSRRR